MPGKAAEALDRYLADRPIVRGEPAVRTTWKQVIQVTAGSRQFVVPRDECRLANGELAFPPQVGQPEPPLPNCFSTLIGSTLRQSRDPRASGIPLHEVRSIRSAAADILTFYEDCTSRGGLVRSKEPLVGRAGPGFEAENAEFRFWIDLYQHTDLTFWTIHSRTKPCTRPTAVGSRR